jgi:hypothetical protein
MGVIKLLAAPIRSIVRFPLFQLAVVVAVILLLQAAVEPSAQAIRNWVAQADRDEGRREDGLTTAERDELSRLRRENRQLRLEREILSKAAA